MLDLLKQFMPNVDFDVVYYGIVILLGAIFGGPLLVKELPASWVDRLKALPIIRRFTAAPVAVDDFTVGMNDIRDLEAINKRANVALDVRQQRLRERFEALIVVLTEPPK